MNLKNIAILAAGAAAINDNPRSPNVQPDAVAKPWYMSLGVLALIAGMILAAITHFVPAEDLPYFVTKDNIVEFLLWFIPMAIGLFGRVKATTVITPTAAKAEVLNAKVGAEA